MAHDDPYAGKTITADWAHDLSRATTYTPALTADTTDPDLGADGEAVGWYHRNGHLITGGFQIRGVGSGVSVGSGHLIVSLPLDADTSLLSTSSGGNAGLNHPLGSGFHRHDTTSNSQVLTVAIRTASTVHLYHGGSGTPLEASDLSSSEFRLTGLFVYPADPDAL